MATVSDGIQYAERVLSGEIVAGELVRLACQRFLNDLELGPERGIYFSEDRAQHVLDFYNFVPHVKGALAGKPIELMAWHVFILINIFGFVIPLIDEMTGEQMFDEDGDAIMVRRFADVNQAMAEMSTQVQAQFNDVTATLEDKLTAVVDATGASAIYTLKTGVRINGVMYNAGMSIAVLAEAGKPVVTRVGFNANQFVLMSGSGDTQYSPFAVVNGQVFISDAFIQNASISFGKISDTLQSTNYVSGSAGWKLPKSGNAEFNTGTFRGSLYAQNGNFSFNGTSNTVVLNGSGVTVNLSGGGMIRLGTW